jgi:hypothetical protein
MSSLYYPKAVCTLRIVFEDYKQGSSVKLQETYHVQCRPKRLEVNINDYTQADTCSLELDYKNFPFDPRTIRALGVTAHMEDTSNELIPSPSNTIFQGFADENTIELDDTNRFVKFECRDFTALLIDAPYPKGSTIPLTTPLEQILKDIVAALPATADLKVENRSNETLPTLAQFAPDFGSLEGQKNVRRDDTYWDVIQDLVSRAGLIAYIELDKLVISKPRVLYSKDKAIQFIYGRNLKKLEFKRKLGRQKNFNIKVLSLSIESKQVIEALIPEEATEEWSKDIGIVRERIKIPKNEVKSYGKGTVKNGVTTAVSSGSPRAKKDEEEDAPFLTFRIPNIKNKPQLIKIGEGIFEEVGRQQIDGSMETKEMRIFQDDKNNVRTDYNLLKVRNGTPIGIEIRQADMVAMARSSSIEDRKRYLQSVGYEANTAIGIVDALAASYGKTPMVFYTKSVRFNLDDQGFTMSLDFVNFIELQNRLLK